jgi:TatD DNase family protein
MNLFIDTHTHIYDKDFDGELPEIVGRAKENGICKVLLPGIDKSYHNALMEVSSAYPGYALPCTGLHPTSVKQNWEEEVAFVSGNLEKGGYIAIGETGLDGYWSREFMSGQKEAFRQQAELASKYNLPLIIHTREATAEVFEVLESCRHLSLRGVFHAYSGSYETFTRIKKYGDFKIGIGGVLTYKNSHLPEVVKKTGLKDILLETDAPWLTPVPFRGKRNEPSYIAIIAQKLAEILDVSIEEVASATTLNACSLFGI